jgi:hypothetical protein
MNLPMELQHLIESAVHSMHENPQHDLGIEVINKLGQEVGSLVDSAHLQDLPHRRRCALILLTAEHILPLWQKEYSNIRMPERLLRGTVKALRGAGDWESLRYDLAEFWEQLHKVDEATRIRQGEVCLGNPDLNPTILSAQFAGGAIASGLEAIINIDDDLEAPGSANGCGNGCVLMAGTAYASGMAGQAGSDPEKRLEFWEWWLLEAIPAAWRYEPRRGANEPPLEPETFRDGLRTQRS